MTRFEMTERGDLRCTTTMPNLIVGTVGGGTRMPTAREALRIAGCEGPGSAPRFAELCAALSLAGEISISAALCAGDFAAAHAVYGRPSVGAPGSHARPEDGERTTARPTATHVAAPGPQLPSGVAHRAAFDRIRYATVWEDADVVCEALSPVARDARILSVASAGDNALALLTLDPAEVVAVDLSVAQLACVELRIAAFKELDHASLVSFLGFAPHPDRGRTYLRIRQHLSGPARAVWDARPRAILAGPAVVGRFERYLFLFRNWLLPLVHRRKTVRRLLEPMPQAAREDFYARRWNNWRWRLLSRLFFSRGMMGRHGRDPAFFDEVEVDVGTALFERNERFLRSSRVEDNPYLTLLLTGGFGEAPLPRYLRPEFHESIRGRLSRIRLVHAGVEEMGGPFDAFNLSDVLEYMRPHEHEAASERLVRMAAPGARVAYWELFVDRPLMPAAGRVPLELPGESERLSAKALTWFYRGLRVWEIGP